MKRLTQNLRHFALAMAVLLLVASCQADKEVVPSKPALPSEESLAMNMDMYNGAEGSANRELTKNNFGLAILSAAYWTGAANLVTIVPRMAFSAVIHADQAEYDAEREAWVWTAEFNYMTKAYVAQLLARPDGEKVNWEMWITTEGEDDFLWFDGTTSVDAHEAVWNLRRKEMPNQTFLTVEYIKNVEEGTWSIQYSNEENGYILFGVNQNADFDVFYDIYNKKDDKLFQIKWNRTNDNGYIINAEGVKYCWDTNREDVDCQ